MTYHAHIKARVKTAARSLGTRLGKAAISKGLSVQQIALLTGASRSTIYNWFAGNGVTNAYRVSVLELTRTLRNGSKETIMQLKNQKPTPTPKRIRN